jgi:hypothetical protein
MRRHLTLVALLFLDVAVFRGLTWLLEAVKVSAEIELPLVAEFAFSIAGILVLVLIPLVAWHLLTRTDSGSSRIPAARIVR